jgi:hypothetical protein
VGLLRKAGAVVTVVSILSAEEALSVLLKVLPLPLVGVGAEHRMVALVAALEALVFRGGVILDNALLNQLVDRLAVRLPTKVLPSRLHPDLAVIYDDAVHLLLSVHGRLCSLKVQY